MNRNDWELKYHLMENKCCNNCCWYKHFDDELVQADDAGDISDSFCRAMREDGIEYYKFDMGHDEMTMVCARWVSDGSR